MSILRATLSQLVAGQRSINRWYYITGGDIPSFNPAFGLYNVLGAESTTVPGTLQGGTPLAALSVLQQSDVRFVSLFIEDLYDLDILYEGVYSDGTNGLKGQPALPPFNAFGFRTSRITRAIRRGYKRFPGVAETDINSGGVFTAPTITEMEIVADRMGNVLEYTDGGSTVTYTPAILGFEPYVTPSGNTAYQKYPTLAEQLENSATGFTWEVYTDVRSQVSRQRGRGD